LTKRNGVVESINEIDAVVVDRDGVLLATHGDPDHVLFYRSAIKPLQATIAQELGADLGPEHLAIATASHSGFPTHLALVDTMLREVGLDRRDLQTTPGWPLEIPARDLCIASGHRRPQPRFHNCSGKHAAFLRACVAQGWPTATYRDPGHPLQQAVGERIADVSGFDGRPAGVDGCGAPAFRGTIRSLAHVFAAVSADAEYAPVASAMSRFPSLVSGPGRPDGILGRWWAAPIKVGAEGILAAGRHGIGLAVKSRSGSAVIASMAMMELMRRLGMLSVAAVNALERVARPPVLGGGRIQGFIEIEGTPE
jgi:L-asparaginase II